MCPVTNEKLEPNSIRKPGRIITNMLAELERYCLNRSEGCTWTGPNEQVESHLKVCANRKKSDLMEELNSKGSLNYNLIIITHSLTHLHCTVIDAIITKLKKKITTLNSKLSEMEEENKSLTLALAICDRKLKVYDAFYESENNFYNDDDSTVASNNSNNSGISALQHIARLRNLTTMLEESKENTYDIRGKK